MWIFLCRHLSVWRADLRQLEHRLHYVCDTGSCSQVSMTWAGSYSGRPLSVFAAVRLLLQRLTSSFHSFPVQHFCLSDACNWFIRMASLPPPSGLSLDWRPCCLWQEQHADRQENKLQVTSPQSVTVAVGFLVGQSRISPSEVVFLILHSHAS